MKKMRTERFHLWEYLVFFAVTAAVFCLCVCVGSVNIPLGEIGTVLKNAFLGQPQTNALASSILIPVRIPRVLCVALTGAALSVAGTAMQGLLKNPLADGSTLGVSSGAALGAVIAIAFGVVFPQIPFGATTVMAILFAFLSLMIILGLAYKLDYSLSTNTIILIGVIYSMFVSSAMNIVITFATDKIQSITFWTMGSLQGTGYTDAALLGVTLLLCGGLIFFHARVSGLPVPGSILMPALVQFVAGQRAPVQGAPYVPDVGHDEGDEERYPRHDAQREEARRAVGYRQ